MIFHSSNFPIFCRFPDEAKTVLTPEEYGYKYAKIGIERQSAMVFRVRACADATISLTNMFRIYEIVIGGWGKTFFVKKLILGINGPKSITTT